MIPFPDISPNVFAVQLFGTEFALRWYALAYIFGILIGWRLFLYAVRSPSLWADTPPMTEDQVERFLTWVVLGVILGGRLGYVIFYGKQAGYMDDPVRIIQIWDGGMSFHGGFAGVVIAGLWFCARERLPMLPVGDLLAIATPAGLFLGRIANFINAELWGRETNLPWGVIFPGAGQNCSNLVGLCARHPSQLYEATLEGLLLLVLLTWLAFRRGWLKQPGAIMGLFLTGYGLARFLVEFVRQPDEQFISPGNPLGLAVHLGGYGLTMGQLLSLPMIAVGLWLLARARKG